MLIISYEWKDMTLENNTYITCAKSLTDGVMLVIVYISGNKLIHKEVYDGVEYGFEKSIDKSKLTIVGEGYDGNQVYAGQWIQ